jgi:hypothetical protein
MNRLSALLLFGGALAQGQLLSPVWIEVGEGGRAIARVVVGRSEDCPNIQIDGVSRMMTLRQPVPAGFRPACELAIPAGTRAARVNGQNLPLPEPDPTRVIVIGDTGCRISGDRLQDCNDPSKWPFGRVAGAAASARPGLVVHVGDYLYREDPCPPEASAQCGGTAFGDNWNAWNADFFKPAAKLLAAAPWVLSRGNHETCQRSWRGWFYYLDPHPWTESACQVMPPPYTVQLGAFQLIEFDSSALVEASVEPEQLRVYASQLASLHATHAWLVDHHPFFGIKPGQAAGDAPLPQSLVLQQAWDQALPKGIDMILSGHTHLFEVLGYGAARPVQIVAGDGGTNLAAAVPEKVNGMDVHGVMVAASENQHQFGYTLLTRTGSEKPGVRWTLTLKTPANETVTTCQIQGQQFKCAHAAK